MLKGGVIMDVTTAEEARIAEEAGAVAVMALERVPADIRKEGGVARMSDPTMIREIKKAVTIPVMAKARIGHFVEAQILEALEVDYVDESEVNGRSGMLAEGKNSFFKSCSALSHAVACCEKCNKGSCEEYTLLAKDLLPSSVWPSMLVYAVLVIKHAVTAGAHASR